jgi:hypothetical protein
MNQLKQGTAVTLSLFFVAETPSFLIDGAAWKRVAFFVQTFRRPGK